MCPRCRKVVKSSNSLTRYDNAYKIPVALSSRPLPKPEQSLKYNNISNFLDVLSDNNEENLRPANIDKQKPATLSGFTPKNGLLSELFPTLREVTFSKSKFLIGTLVLRTRYKYLRNQKRTYIIYIMTSLLMY